MADSTTFGKYKLIAELGHGGMADVFLAVQAGPIGSGFSKLTVVKRLRPNLAEEPEFISMLVDEARIAARLNHPNVVQTNEVGEADQQYFIAMEYLDGQPFHRIQHRAGQRAKDGPALLTREQQYVVVMDALAGLHHAHELQDYDGTPLDIVHRDITPHNIFVTYEGQVKVVDFGIAKAVGRSSETRQGVVKGKVRYMAPEQAIGQDIDRRADIFAAGVILWEIAAGRRMWKDMDDLRIVQALVSGEAPTSPREVEPSVPEAIDKICRRALARSAKDRYATAEEFRLDLEQHLAESGALVNARRKLPGVIGELFKDKRAEIRGIIERQLALVSKPSGEYSAYPLPPDSFASSAHHTLSSDDRVATTSVTDQKTVVYEPPPPPSRKLRRGAILVAIVAAVGGVGVLAWRRVGVARATASATSPEAPPSDDISLHVTARPDSATVRLDDGAPQALPLQVRVHRDGATHKLSFQANGYVGKTEMVDYLRDVDLGVDLVAVAPVAAAAKDNKDRPKAPSAGWTPPAAPRATARAAADTARAAGPDTVGAPTAKPAASGRLGLDKTDPWGNGPK